MLGQGRHNKKRKATLEPEKYPKQPIEALQRFKGLHASWPEDVTSLLSEELSQASTHHF